MTLRPSNKALKLTVPGISEHRSLARCWADNRRNDDG